MCIRRYDDITLASAQQLSLNVLIYVSIWGFSQH